MLGLSKWLSVKNPPANAGDARDADSVRVGKIPWSRKWQPTPAFLAWKIPRTEEPGGLQSGVTKSRTCLSTHMPCQKMNVHVSVIFVSQRYAFVGVCGGPYSLLSSFRV